MPLTVVNNRTMYNVRLQSMRAFPNFKPTRAALSVGATRLSR